MRLNLLLLKVRKGPISVMLNRDSSLNASLYNTRRDPRGYWMRLQCIFLGVGDEKWMGTGS